MLKWLFTRTETDNKYVWLRMARLEMNSNLKTSGRVFQVCALVLPIKSKKLILASFFFFENSFEFVSLLV